MITTKYPTPNIKVEAPTVQVAAPQVKVSPVINVSPAEAKVMIQTIPAAEVNVVAHKPCSWEFQITRDKLGLIAKISATPK